MATDHDALVVEYAADQLLNPLDPVDFFVQGADGVYKPASGGDPAEEPPAEPEVAKTRTTTTKK